MKLCSLIAGVLTALATLTSPGISADDWCATWITNPSNVAALFASGIFTSDLN